MATDLYNLFKVKLAELEAEKAANHDTFPDSILREMAMRVALKEFESGNSGHKVTTSLTSFSKYEGDTAPETFIATFEAECELANVTKDEDKKKLFPSLM